MKSVLISIKPKWCELIASGKKTIEVRKTRPKCDTPFKCYIYQTVGGRTNTVDILENNLGKVIGEFVCDKIDKFHEWQLSPQGKYQKAEQHDLDIFLLESCLTFEQVAKYRENLPYFKPLYGWHISDLVIYDKPKELSEFVTFCDKDTKCCLKCRHYLFDSDDLNGYRRWCDVYRRKPLTRPPQSWCYVKEVEE